MLSQSFSEHLKSLKSTLDRSEKSENRGTVDLTPYDFHAAVKVGGNEGVRYDIGRGMKGVVAGMENFGWTAIDSETGEVIEEQQGVFRTNCLDW
jgi:gamma-glutamylcysteine synthetase